MAPPLFREIVCIFLYMYLLQKKHHRSNRPHPFLCGPYTLDNDATCLIYESLYLQRNRHIMVSFILMTITFVKVKIYAIGFPVGWRNRV